MYILSSRAEKSKDMPEVRREMNASPSPLATWPLAWDPLAPAPGLAGEAPVVVGTVEDPGMAVLRRGTRLRRMRSLNSKPCRVGGPAELRA